MINFTVYSADCVGNSGNCMYPNKNIVTDKESFIAATKMDHVTAKYKGNYRSKDNFESSDCIPLDCDNDHSENPEDWLTPFDIALSIPGVVFAASYSRHHNLPKGDKSARPRFHVFFPIPSQDDAPTNKGPSVRLAPDEVMHIPGLGFDGLVGYSPIAMAKNAIGLAIAAEEYGSKFYANGAAPSGGAKNITVIPARKRVGNTATADNKPKLKVAAYCRVSTDSEEQATSYDAQVEHYTEFIRKNPEWECCPSN